VAPEEGTEDTSDKLGWPFGDETYEAPAFEEVSRDSISALDAAASAPMVTMMPAVNHG
jgi:hypothetical protein